MLSTFEIIVLFLLSFNFFFNLILIGFAMDIFTKIKEKKKEGSD